MYKCFANVNTTVNLLSSKYIPSAPAAIGDIDIQFTYFAKQFYLSINISSQTGPDLSVLQLFKKYILFIPWLLYKCFFVISVICSVMREYMHVHLYLENDS